MNKYIVVMPGGQGTMQELGTAFFKVAAETDQEQKIIFVAKAFYEPLYKILKESSLSASMKSRMFLVNSPEEIWPIIGISNPPTIEPRKKAQPLPVREIDTGKKRYFPGEDPERVWEQY
jgi:predicted Rossmann-fold nucleotide-binding protein